MEVKEDMKSFTLTNRRDRPATKLKVTYYSLILLFCFGSLPIGSAEPISQKGEVISADEVTKKQVGGGKAIIEIFKEGKNAFVGRLTVAPNGAVPLHQDPTEEYLLIESGSGHITIDGVQKPVKKGDFIYMPAMAKVSFKNGPQPLVALQIFAGPQSARKYDKWQKMKAK